MWIEKSTGEVSTVGIDDPSPWVDPAFLRRIQSSDADWIADSEELLYELREEFWAELGEPAWSPAEDGFAFVTPPTTIRLADSGEATLDDLVRSQIRRVELRWRFDLIGILSEAIFVVEESR